MNKLEKRSEMKCDDGGGRGDKEPDRAMTTMRQVYLTIVANLTILSPGMSMGWSGVALPFLTHYTWLHQLTKDQASWVASISSIATPVGCLISGPLLDRYGRKRALYSVSVVMVVGWVIIALADNEHAYVLLLVGRFVTGIGCGLSSIPATVYASEISTPKLRGMLATWTTVSFTVGVLLIYILGYFLRDKWDVSAWIAGAIAAISLVAARAVLPESPVWSRTSRAASRRSRRRVADRSKRREKKNDEDEEREYSAVATEDEAAADRSDVIVEHGEENGEEDVAETTNGDVRTGRGDSIDADGSTSSTLCRTCHGLLDAAVERSLRLLSILGRPECLKPFLIMSGYFMFQQFSGTFIVIFYAVDVIVEAGIRGVDPFVVAIVIGVTRTVAAVLIGYISKRWGRRPPSIASGAAMTLCMIVIAEYLYLSHCHAPTTTTAPPPKERPWDIEGPFVNYEKHPEGPPFVETERPATPDVGAHDWVPIATLVVYFFTSTLGFLSIPFAMVGEIYPESVRGVLGGLTSCVGYTFSFVIIKLYPTMLTGMSRSGLFLFYGVVSFVGTVFVVAFLPETQGKSLEEIESMFRRDRTRPNLRLDAEASASVIEQDDIGD